MTLLKFALVTVAVALAVTPVAAAPKVGEVAPEFTAVDSKGKSHRLSDFKGKTVILEWTNDGCPYVQKHYGSGNMQALQKDTTGKGIVWLSVISSAPGEQGHVDGAGADKLSDTRQAAPTAVLLDVDGKVGRLYDARTTPHMYVITPDGKLAYNGAIDDKPTNDPADVKTAKNLVRNALDLIAAGKPVDPAITRAYGCSVKYKS
jgi:AhpC/TSA family